MRNLKKVLTLVLTLAMLLSVMVVGAGAAFSDQTSIKNTEAVDACTSLSIIGGYEDGTFRPNGNVTRAEMCKMICVALNGGKEPTVGSNLTSTFNDVRGTADWAEKYIEYCVREKVVAGVGGGNFNPTGNVTGSQAAKMLLVILGYDPAIQGYVGSNAWELNINGDAAKKGLYAGLETIDASAPLTRDSAARMIWNALNAYEVEYKTTLVSNNGVLTSQVIVQDKVSDDSLRQRITLLEDKYEAHVAIGIFDGNHDTGDSSSATIKDGCIKITNVKIDGEAASDCTFKSDFDLKYIGEEVKVLYRNGQDGNNDILDEPDIIYGVFVTGNTTVYNIVKDDIQDVDSTANKVKFNDTKYSYDPSGAIIYNYGAKTADTLASLSSLEVASGDTIKFIVDDASGKIDTAYVMEYNIGKVTALNSSKVSVSGVGTIDRDGNSIYDGIATGDVVVSCQMYDTDKNDATFVITKAQTVSGDVNSFLNGSKLSLSGQTYYLDETELSTGLMPDLTDNAIREFKDSNLDKSATLYLINGFVGAADSEAKDVSYGLILTAYNMDRVDYAIASAQVQLLTIEGKTVYTLDEDSQAAINKVATAESLDKTDDSDWSVWLVEFSKASDTSIVIEEFITNKTTVGSGNLYNKETKSLATSFTAGTPPTVAWTVVDPDAVFFTSTSATGDYKAYNLSSLGNIPASSTDLYFVTDGGLVIAAFADLQVRPSGTSVAEKYGIVTEVLKRANGEDGKPYNTYAVWAGEETTIQTPDNLDKGDLVYFEKSTDNTYRAGEIVKLCSDNGTVQSPVDVSVRAVLVDANERLDRGILRCMDSYGATVEGVPVDEDVQIIYVDMAANKGGETLDANGGVPIYDSVNKYKNVLLVYSDSDNKVDAIIVDVNGDILDRANNPSTYELTCASTTIAEVNGAGYTLQISPTLTVTGTPKYAEDTGIDVTVVPSAAVDTGKTNKVTVTITYNTSITETADVYFTPEDGTTPKTVKFSMPGYDTAVSATAADYVAP